MKRLTSIFICSVMLGTVGISSAGTSWQENLTELLQTDDPGTRTELIEKIVASEPDWQEVSQVIEMQSFPQPAERGLILRHNLCEDNVERPWVLYIPESYNPDTPTPLLLALHGGVSRAELIEEPLEYASETAYYQLAKEQGMLAVWPLGQKDAVWWDEVGMDNIRDQLLTVKREFNVDDDRLYMIGYSDGASAGFCWAMLEPNWFAGFIALSGHLGVGSLDGELPTFATNLANTALYAVTSFEDQLYPSARMRGTLEMALEAGGDIFYREQEGPHDFSYAEEELPLVTRFIERHPRDPFAPRLSWETTGAQFGSCRWLSVDQVSSATAADWYQDYNYALTNDRITVGFMPDNDFEGDGMRVDSVLDGTFAKTAGLLEGDIIIRAGSFKIKDNDDLLEWKAAVKRGDKVELEVLRGGGNVVLQGALPPVDSYFLFKRERPSGRVKALFHGNQVELITSRVGAVSILIHPDMFRLEREIGITLDGRELFNGLVEPDLEFMLRNFLQERDRRLLYVARIELEL